jgi:FMN phosphatase YigB (HAD superfamily)
MIKAVLFDFGGVLAEEGFREGLKAIGMQWT